MKNEKLSETVKAVCLMARHGVQEKYSSKDTAGNEMIKRIELLEDKLVPILEDLEAQKN